MMDMPSRQCCQVKILQIARMGSKYGQKWPDLDFTNGKLKGQLSDLDYALKWSNFERTIG